MAIGGGGSGKTHFNLTDPGLVSVVYVAPSWKLARNKADEYGVMVATHSALLNCDPTNYAFKTATTILIDEVSMLTNEEKVAICRGYQYHKLIFAGDINYQIPFVSIFKTGKLFANGGPTTFNVDLMENIREFKHDYRAKCPKLGEIKETIRWMIDEGSGWVNQSLLNKFNTVSESELRSRYSIEDMILCNSNNKKDSYSDIVTGVINKYYVTKTNPNRSCGDIVFLPEPEEDMEIRHAYTVHSIQGETCRTNLYIRADGMDLRMFYTAVSRAEYFDKIFIVL